ncbi:AraC family transcriptional regulator [Myroides odoratus]|uniref:helix-turn-helix domain-containing protein n=1 Tax=Myroides odoratus TaxID=256 RepID=UPI0033412C3A
MLSSIELKSIYGFDAGTATYLTENDHLFQQHNDVYQLLWLQKGKVSVIMSTNKKELTEGDCLFLGKNELFRLTADESYSLCYVQFTDNFYCRTEVDRHFLDKCVFFDNTKAINSITLKPEQTAFAQYYFISLLKLQSKTYSNLNYMTAHNIIERVLLFIMACHINTYVEFNKEKLSPAQLKNVIKFNELIKTNIRNERNVQFYADHMNISVSKLTEISKDIYGTTPKKIIASAVVNEVKLLLKHTPLTIKEIAYELNFEDSSNFTRFFIKATGLSPKEYRESL